MHLNLPDGWRSYQLLHALGRARFDVSNEIHVQAMPDKPSLLLRNSDPRDHHNLFFRETKENGNYFFIRT